MKTLAAAHPNKLVVTVPDLTTEPNLYAIAPFRRGNGNSKAKKDKKNTTEGGAGTNGNGGNIEGNPHAGGNRGGRGGGGARGNGGGGRGRGGRARGGGSARGGGARYNPGDGGNGGRGRGRGGTARGGGSARGRGALYNPGGGDNGGRGRGRGGGRARGGGSARSGGALYKPGGSDPDDDQDNDDDSDDSDDDSDDSDDDSDDEGRHTPEAQARSMFARRYGHLLRDRGLQAKISFRRLGDGSLAEYVGSAFEIYVSREGRSLVRFVSLSHAGGYRTARIQRITSVLEADHTEGWRWALTVGAQLQLRL